MRKNEKKFPNNIIDIKFLGNRAYVLKEMNLSSKEVENQLQNLTYSGQKRKNSIRTERQRFPPFALAFFNLLFRNQKIPSEQDLLGFYMANFFRTTATGEILCKYEDQIIKVDLEAFKGRLLRTYPSLIRDYHFFLKCTETKYFDKVTYSLRQDYFDGIDITVTSGNLIKHISLHTKTGKGKFYKSQKIFRHDYEDKNEIILELDFQNNSKKVSDFYLYPDDVVEELIQKVEEEKAEYNSKEP